MMYCNTTVIAAALFLGNGMLDRGFDASSGIFNRSRLRPVISDGVEPCHLQTWRISHCVLEPCCLCPMADDTEPDFKEAAIYQVRDVSMEGQYVASCARDF